MGLRLERKDAVVFVRLPAQIDLFVVDTFVKHVMAEFASRSPTAFVLDLTHCQAIDPSFFTQLTVVHDHLDRHAVSLYALAPTPALDTMLRSNRIDRIATIVRSEVELSVSTQSELPKFIDNEVLEPFVTGAIRTMRVQFNLEAHAAQPFIKGRKPDVPCHIAATTALISNLLNGTLTVLFPEKVFLTMMSNMLGQQYTAITDDIQDGAAEFLNIIFGWARNTLNARAYGFESTIPTVVYGKQVSSSAGTRAATVVIQFQTAAGGFQLEIASKD